MPGTTKTILCGQCRVAVEGPTNPQPHDRISCPSCGREDSFKNVMSSIEAYIAEAGSRQLQETMRKAARGSKMLKFTSKPTPKRSYRFIVDGQIF